MDKHEWILVEQNGTNKYFECSCHQILNGEPPHKYEITDESEVVWRMSNHNLGMAGKAYKYN